MESKRSLLKVTKNDLCKLGVIAKRDREDFFSRYPEKKARHLCTALCQGAALHYINGKNGVKDFDVWSFYFNAKIGKEYPPRRKISKDFGQSKFGVWSKDKKAGYIGRRVDLFGRSIEILKHESLARAIQRYLKEAKTPTSRELSRKAIVLIEPKALQGKIIWPV